MSNTAMKKTMKLQTEEALKNVQAIIDDADAALKDKTRKLSDSPIKKAILGVGVAGTITSILPLVGLVASPFTLSVAISGVAFAVHKKRRLKDTKEILKNHL